MLSLLSLIYVLIPDRSMAWRYDLRVGKAFLVLRHRARCVIIQISCCCALQCFPYCVALHININIALATEGNSLYKAYELESNLIRKQIGLSSANVFPE